MKNILRTALFLSLGLLQAAVFAYSAQVYSPRTSALGNAFTVFVRWAPNITGMSVRLANPSGIVVNAARGFPYTASSAVKAWVAVVAVPSAVSPGSYHVRTAVTTSGRTQRTSTTIAIAARTFEKQNIYLNPLLSRLQGENTPLKRAQAAKLWAMITTFRPAAVYQPGPFIMPVKGYRVSSPYGARRFFVFAHGGGQYSVHQGVDLAIPAGSIIRAAGAGKVVSAAPWLMTGNTVVIEDLPEVYSLYFHFSRMDVHAGETVRQGQVLGLSGATGLATGPVLDYKVEVEGVAVNPLTLVEHGLIDTQAILSRLE